MGYKRVNTENTKEIMLRFFGAVKALKAQGKLKSKDAYCDLLGIDKANYRRQERNLSSSSFQVSWMVPLIADFGVSADWLLTGRGGMLFS